MITAFKFVTSIKITFFRQIYIPSLKLKKIILLCFQCNNPLTKEAKLTAAVRILPEWKGYDEEIKRVQLRLGSTEDHEEEHIPVETPSKLKDL